MNFNGLEHMSQRRFSRPQWALFLALSSSETLACRPPSTSPVTAIAVPSCDSALIDGVWPDSIRLDVHEPGYVLVFAVQESGAWYVAHPRPFKSAAYIASPTTVPIWRPAGYSSVSSAAAGLWPSEQMRRAEPSLTTPPMAVGTSMTAGVGGAGPARVPVSYLVIITATEPPDLESLTRRMSSVEQPRHLSLIAPWLARQVARQLPVRRWSVF